MARVWRRRVRALVIVAAAAAWGGWWRWRWAGRWWSGGGGGQAGLVGWGQLAQIGGKVAVVARGWKAGLAATAQLAVQARWCWCWWRRQEMEWWWWRAGGGVAAKEVWGWGKRKEGPPVQVKPSPK